MASSAFTVQGRGNFQLVQQESFTVCIRNNVREYGGGDICLREQLANADDARATHFTVCLDKSRYSTRGLLSEAMSELQGAALLIGNNAEFSEDDLRNYTLKVGNSSKANDPSTTGKFGKGALTAYSLTDVIQLISGKQLLILDPHCTHLPEGLSSLACNFVDDSDQFYLDLLTEAPGQLEPFMSFTQACAGVPDLKSNTPYSGTLFRLSLRTEAAAIASHISNESTTADQLGQTLADFVRVAPDLLLFTRSVERISVYVREDTASTAKLLHSCSAKVESKQLSSCPIQLQRLTVSMQNAVSHRSKKLWLQAFNRSEEANGAGVAILLQDDAATVNKLPPLAGKVFSTMMLPFEDTGLPVHINGAFCMSSDRRKLWEGEGDRGQVSNLHAKYIDSSCLCQEKGFQLLCLQPYHKEIACSMSGLACSSASASDVLASLHLQLCLLLPKNAVLQNPPPRVHPPYCLTAAHVLCYVLLSFMALTVQHDARQGSCW